MTTNRQSEGLYHIAVDLSGSNFPEAISVECLVAWPDPTSLDHVRYLAAQHYNVPLDQVAQPRRLK